MNNFISFHFTFVRRFNVLLGTNSGRRKLFNLDQLIIPNVSFERFVYSDLISSEQIKDGC